MSEYVSICDVCGNDMNDGDVASALVGGTMRLNDGFCVDEGDDSTEFLFCFDCNSAFFDKELPALQKRMRKG